MKNLETPGKTGRVGRYKCRVEFSTQSDQPCRNLSHLYFRLIRSFTDPVYTFSIFVCGPLLIAYLNIDRPAPVLKLYFHWILIACSSIAFTARSNYSVVCSFVLSNNNVRRCKQ